jgi:hypothetical protein
MLSLVKCPSRLSKADINRRPRDVRSALETYIPKPLILRIGNSRQRPLCADSVAKVLKGAAANFPPKNEKNDNRRSIEPQTHYENRL